MDGELIRWTTDTYMWLWYHCDAAVSGGFSASHQCPPSVLGKFSVCHIINSQPPLALNATTPTAVLQPHTRNPEPVQFSFALGVFFLVIGRPYIPFRGNTSPLRPQRLEKNYTSFSRFSCNLLCSNYQFHMSPKIFNKLQQTNNEQKSNEGRCRQENTKQKRVRLGAWHGMDISRNIDYGMAWWGESNNKHRLTIACCSVVLLEFRHDG